MPPPLSVYARLTLTELRSSSPPQRPNSFRPHSLLTSLNLRSNPPDFVAQAYIEHRLPGVLQQIHDLSRRGSQIKMSTVGKKVILRSRADSGGKAGAEFPPQEADDFAHALEGEASSAKLADDRHSD